MHLLGRSLLRIVRTGTVAVAAALAVCDARAVELNLWVMSTTEQQQQDMRELLRPFLLRRPDLRVNVTVLSWESAWTKITAAAAAGQGPDVLELGTTWLAAVASMGALQPLTDAQVQSIGGAKAFLPASWGTTRMAGDPRSYAVPWYSDTRAAFYRTDVFAKAGVDPKDAFANWGSFRQALRRIHGTTIDGRPLAALGYPGKNDWNVVHNIAPWVWNAGGDFLSNDNKRVTLNGPEALHAVSYYAGLAAEGLVPKDALEQNSSRIETGFFAGQYAVIFSGSWVLKSLRTPKSRGGYLESKAANNFAVAPYPAGLAGQFTLCSGSDLAIMNSSRHKEDAWQLVTYLSSHAPQVSYARMTGMLPARISAMEDPGFNSDPMLAQFVDQLKHGRHYPPVPSWGPLESVFLKNFGSVFDLAAGARGAYTQRGLKQLLDDATREADLVLSTTR